MDPSIISALGGLLRDSEITQTLKSFKPLKNPRPQGLHHVLYQNYWDIMEEQTILFCKKVFDNSEMPPAANKILICLISKTPDTSILKNFKPISLCNTNYKLITKIIINRIKPLLFSLNSQSQANFLTNRRVSDNVIIMQEFIIHFGKMRGRKGHMNLKIDLEKAFDRLEWSFIKDTFFLLGFPEIL